MELVREGAPSDEGKAKNWYSVVHISPASYALLLGEDLSTFREQNLSTTVDSGRGVRCQLREGHDARNLKRLKGLKSLVESSKYAKDFPRPA